jgi:hypothetical protein
LGRVCPLGSDSVTALSQRGMLYSVMKWSSATGSSRARWPRLPREEALQALFVEMQRVQQRAEQLRRR